MPPSVLPAALDELGQERVGLPRLAEVFLLQKVCETLIPTQRRCIAGHLLPAYMAHLWNQCWHGR